jgi:hypothetical protein
MRDAFDRINALDILFSCLEMISKRNKVLSIKFFFFFPLTLQKIVSGSNNRIVKPATAFDNVQRHFQNRVNSQDTHTSVKEYSTLKQQEGKLTIALVSTRNIIMSKSDANREYFAKWFPSFH